MMEENYKSYKDLEEHLKSQANEQEFQYDPADWEALEAMLDRDKKRAFYTRLRPAILGLFFLLLGGASYFGYQNYYSESPSVVKEKYSAVKNQELTHEVNESNVKNNFPKTSQSAPATNEGEINLKESENVLATVQENVSNKSVTKTFTSASHSSLTQSIVSSKNKGSKKPITTKAFYQASDEHTFSTQSRSPNSVLSENSNFSSGMSGLPDAEIQSVIGASVSSPLFWLDKIAISEFDFLPVHYANPSQVEITPINHTPRFLLGANLGLEVSKTSQSEISKIDFNTGLGLAYHFNEVYNRGLSIYTNTVSNFMVDEMYDYQYSDASKNWTGHWVGSHQTLFSSLETGIQYDFLASANSIVSVTAYSKVPVRGIGHGDLKLNSYGVRMAFGFLK